MCLNWEWRFVYGMDVWNFSIGGYVFSGIPLSSLDFLGFLSPLGRHCSFPEVMTHRDVWRIGVPVDKRVDISQRKLRCFRLSVRLSFLFSWIWEESIDRLTFISSGHDWFDPPQSTMFSGTGWKSYLRHLEKLSSFDSSYYSLIYSFQLCL